MPPDTIAQLLANPWIPSALILLVGILLGWVADRVIRVWLMSWAKTTPWKGDEIFLDSLKGIMWLWVGLAGLHLAAKVAPDTQHLRVITGRLAEVLFIASLTLALARVATSSFALYAARLQFKGSATVVPLMVQIILFTIGGLVILQTEGVSIAPILTALGVGGLAVALALQDTLGNLFAGIHILMAGQIRPGDFVRLDAENEGWVMDIGWRNTSIRTMAQNIIVVPNKRLGEAIVTNLTMPLQDMALRVAVGVAYESDLEHVEQTLLIIGKEVLVQTTGVNPEAEPVVRFVGFGDSSIEARLTVMVRDIEAFYFVRHVLVKAIHARFREAGITIAYPTRTVYMADAQATAPGASPSSQPVPSPQVIRPFKPVAGDHD